MATCCSPRREPGELMKSNIKPRKGRHKISLSLAQCWNMCPFRAFIYNWRFTHGFILCLAFGALALQGCHQLWQLFVSWDSPDANGLRISGTWQIESFLARSTREARNKWIARTMWFIQWIRLLCWRHLKTLFWKKSRSRTHLSKPQSLRFFQYVAGHTKQ